MLWDVLKRAVTGRRVKERDFDMELFKTVSQLVKDFDIKYDPENPVSSSNELADNVWEAALRFYIKVGTYCINTGRVINFTEEEIKEALKEASREITLGEGKDAVKLVDRRVGDAVKPIVAAGIQTAIFSSEDMAFKIYKLCAREPATDGIWGGLESKVAGKYEIKANHPTEIYQYRRNSRVLRKAISAAGRPGMFIMNNAPTSTATISMFDRETGLRPTDPMVCGGLSEMKISYDELNRVAFALDYGSPIVTAHNAVIGGFSGGPSGAAIVAVAGGLQGLLVQQGKVVRPGTIHNRLKTRADRSCIWTAALACQAFARNSHVPTDQGDHPVAGPGTDQYLYEICAYQLGVVVSGAHSLGGTRKFVVGRIEDFGTPMESRWLGEVCKAGAGVSREHANEIAKALLKKYEDKLEDAPMGYAFEQLYDVEKEEPKEDYLEIYSRVKEELEELGMKLE